MLYSWVFFKKTGLPPNREIREIRENQGSLDTIRENQGKKIDLGKNQGKSGYFMYDQYFHTLYILHYFIGVIPLQFCVIPLHLYILKYTTDIDDLFDVFCGILAIKHWLNVLPKF